MQALTERCSGHQAWRLGCSRARGAAWQSWGGLWPAGRVHLLVPGTRSPAAPGCRRQRSGWRGGSCWLGPSGPARCWGSCLPGVVGGSGQKLPWGETGWQRKGSRGCPGSWRWMGRQRLKRPNPRCGASGCCCREGDRAEIRGCSHRETTPEAAPTLQGTISQPKE